MAIMTRFLNPLGGSVRPAKYVVVPQPASAAATTRAAAALIQRLLFFKIPYLDEQRGACRALWHSRGYYAWSSFLQDGRFICKAPPGDGTATPVMCLPAG